MPDTFEDVATLEFVEKLVNGKYPVKVPKFLDQHQWWGNWERDRFNSMEELLKPGMVLWDVGAFDGWQDVILSDLVGGGQNMVLIEPVAENWANIRATWEANYLEMPLATYMGLICPWQGERLEFGDGKLPLINRNLWPKGPDYSKAISVTKFKHINENPETPHIALDYFPAPEPEAINIDVEGAELLVLQSGERLLREYHPWVWVSIHPEFMKARYDTDDAAVHEFMADMGYKGTFLGTDHEQHFLFRKDA